MKRIIVAAIVVYLYGATAAAQTQCTWQAGNTTSIMYTNCSRIGVGTPGPGAAFSNSSVNTNDGGAGMNDHALSWYATGSPGYTAGIENAENSNAGHGLLVKTNSSYSPYIFHAMNGMTSRFTIRSTGWVGINKANPTKALDVVGDTNLEGTARVSSTTTLAGNVGVGTVPDAAIRLNISGPSDVTSYPGSPATMIVASSHANTTPNNGAGIAFRALYAAGNGPTTIATVAAVKESTNDGDYSGALTFGTRMQGTTVGAPMERMRITSTGVVVIGPNEQTGQTAQRLTVNGSVNVTGDITGARVFNAVYQDLAEWVPASEDMMPGTVVVLDPTTNNQVMPSHRSYDTSVAGVVSAQPGVLLGVAGPSKEQVATTGRVKVRVDATRGAIAIGDILVTSDRSGMAMKSQPIDLGGVGIHRPGTVIGKALEPLASGQGEILVLLSLQ